MTQKLYDEFSIQQIANSIRGRYEIYGTAPEDYKWKVSEMPAAIDGLPSISESAEGIVRNTAQTVKLSYEGSVIPPGKFCPTTHDADATRNDWDISSYWGGAAYTQNALTKIDCSNLRSIGDYAFYNSNIEEVVFHNSNTNVLIYWDAFRKTNHLKVFDIDGVRYVGHIDNLASDTLYVFAGSLSDPDNFNTDSHHQFNEGDLVFNRDDNKCYKRVNDEWTLFIPSSSFCGGPGAFKESAIEVLPIMLASGFWHNQFQTSAGFYNSMFEGCTCLRTIYISTHFGNFDSNDRKTQTLENIFKNATHLKSIWIVDPENNTLSDDLFLLNSGRLEKYMFQNCNISNFNMSRIRYLEQYSLWGSVTNSKLSLPNITWMKSQALRENDSLEQLVLGDGTDNYDQNNGGDNPIAREQNLYEITFNFYELPILDSRNNAKKWLQDTVFVSYLGETTTEITEGMAAGNVTINGSSTATTNKSAGPGTVVTYGGKDWERVNNKWTEWGTNGNKRPKLYFPAAQIEGVSGVLQNTKWNQLPALSQMVTAIEGT